MIPTDTPTTKNLEYVQEIEVGDSQELDITNNNNDTNEETEVQEAHISPIKSTTNKRYQDMTNKESQDQINNDMNEKY